MNTITLLVLSLVINAFTIAKAFSPVTNYSIVYKETEYFRLIWDDKGSKSDQDVSIWKVLEPQAGFFPLGDVVEARYGNPITPGKSVFAVDENALRAPVRFEEVWIDVGTHADKSVTVLKMIAPTGYACLGNVAIVRGASWPNLNEYRCVNISLTVKGRYDELWNDKDTGGRQGGGADQPITFYGKDESWTPNRKGIFDNTFISSKGYTQPTSDAYMMSSDYAIVQSLVQQNMSKPYIIKVYQVKEGVREIWNDKGSGSDVDDFSVYRPLGARAAGDIPVAGYIAPAAGITMKAMNEFEDALSDPEGYTQIWNDKGSGAKANVAFYDTKCKPGYVPLGHLAVNNHDTPPGLSDTTCVKGEYTTEGVWEKVWDDDNSGADSDVTVYRAVPKDLSIGQAMDTMGANTDGRIPAYVLKRSVILYVNEKPTTKYILENVQYIFSEQNLLSTTPETLSRTIVQNNGSTPQSVSRSIEYSYTEKHDWTIAQSIESGVDTSITAGVPDIATVTTTVRSTQTTTQTTGEANSRTYKDRIDAPMTVGANSHKTAVVASTRYVADIPYKATLTKIFADGTKEKLNDYEGIYRGIQVNSIRVLYEPDIPISG